MGPHPPKKNEHKDNITSPKKLLPRAIRSEGGKKGGKREDTRRGRKLEGKKSGGTKQGQ